MSNDTTAASESLGLAPPLIARVLRYQRRNDICAAANGIHSTQLRTSDDSKDAHDSTFPAETPGLVRSSIALHTQLSSTPLAPKYENEYPSETFLLAVPSPLANGPFPAILRLSLPWSGVHQYVVLGVCSQRGYVDLSLREGRSFIDFCRRHHALLTSR